MKIKLHSFFVVAFLLIQTLQAQVVANFTSTPPSGCAPLSVNFTDISSGGPTSWSWDFGNGNTATSKNPSAVYSTPGSYTVTLTVFKGGLSSSQTATISVLTKPVANFTTSAMPSCVGKTITFTDASVSGAGTITSWAWDFGDGITQSTSTGIVSHSYPSGGTFPVSVTVTDNNGCTSSIVKSVSVLASPIAAFTGTPLFSCSAPLNATFTNNSTVSGTVSYLWRFGDGTPTSTLTNPSHSYTTPGSYKVTLIVTQGACKDSVVKNNYVVIQNTVANFSANNTTTCVGNTISFTDLSVPASTTRIWDFGDGTATSTLANPTHVFTNPGNYTITLTAGAGGCTDAEIKAAYITVHPLPVAAFTANNTQGCSVPFTVNFTDNSINTTNWVWNFGDGSPISAIQNPSHIYTTPGTYTVSLIATSADGCIDTIIKPAYIFISRPAAQFSATPREGCIPLSVNFTDASTSLVDPIVSYNWDFGNGTTTTASPTISHLYPAAGKYTVRLIVSTASGCKDTTTYTDYIKAGTPPTANFKVIDSLLCFGMVSGYNNLSIATDSTFWDFGDGTKMSLKLPALDPVAHFYGDTGTFTVTLIAYNNGCADTLIQPKIETILPPKPAFGFQLNCTNPYSVSFTDASVGADSITWDFGDGSPILSDLPSPVHVYATRGLKTVTLTAYNSTTGCFFFMTNSFTIADPIAQYTTTPNPGCYPLPVTYGNTAQDATTSLWHFGDGSPDTTAAIPAVHTYALPGSYTSKLIITDINGCKDSITKKIIVQGAIPNFKADTTNGCAPLPILFTDNSVSDSALVQWKWSFGDLALQTVGTPSVNHTYTSAGIYTVKMVVTDKNGCADSITKINYILPTFPAPKFVALADTFACRNEVITFNASSSNVASPATYTWKFGDGISVVGLTTNTTTHAYTSDNTYSVTLIITDKNGCVDSIKHKIFVQHPNADFKDSTNSEGCGFRDVKFTDKSTGTAITNWKWNFGDGATSISQNPNHRYTIPGIYTVSLIVTNSAGCTDTVKYVNLVVVPGPVGTFTFTPKTGCNPLTVTFTAITNNSTEYIWDFGDGVVVTTTTPTITHTYTKKITATPILLLGNTLSNGSPCRLPATNLTGSVVVTTNINVIIDSTQITLKEGEFFIINSSTPGTIGTPVYSWKPYKGLSCTNCHTPSVLGDGSGQTRKYLLTVTDQNGCAGYDSIYVFFLPCKEDLVIPNVFTPNDDGVNDGFEIGGTCEKDKYQLRIYDRWGIALFSSDVKHLAWDGRTSSGQLAPDGVYYYILTLEDKTYSGFLQLVR